MQEVERSCKRLVSRSCAHAPSHAPTPTSSWQRTMFSPRRGRSDRSQKTGRETSRLHCIGRRQSRRRSCRHPWSQHAGLNRKRVCFLRCQQWQQLHQPVEGCPQPRIHCCWPMRGWCGCGWECLHVRCIKLDVVWVSGGTSPSRSPRRRTLACAGRRLDTRAASCCEIRCSRSEWPL